MLVSKLKNQLHKISLENIVYKVNAVFKKSFLPTLIKTTIVIGCICAAVLIVIIGLLIFKIISPSKFTSFYNEFCVPFLTIIKNILFSPNVTYLYTFLFLSALVPTIIGSIKGNLYWYISGLSFTSYFFLPGFFPQLDYSRSGIVVKMYFTICTISFVLSLFGKKKPDKTGRFFLGLSIFALIFLLLSIHFLYKYGWNCEKYHNYFIFGIVINCFISAITQRIYYGETEDVVATWIVLSCSIIGIPLLAVMAFGGVVFSSLIIKNGVGVGEVFWEKSSTSKSYVSSSSNYSYSGSTYSDYGSSWSSYETTSDGLSDTSDISDLRDAMIQDYGSDWSSGM